MTCEHTVLPGTHTWVCTVTPPPYACGFCEMKRLQKENTELRAERSQTVVDLVLALSVRDAARAECNKLLEQKRELAQKLAETRIDGTLSSVNDAINRAGIHCSLSYAQCIDLIALARDEAQEKVVELQEEMSYMAGVRQRDLAKVAERDALWRQVEDLKSAREDESAWLIEHCDSTGATYYWCGKRYTANVWDLRTDHAMRFARKQDAERAIRDHEFKSAVATEHVWCASAKETK